MGEVTVDLDQEAMKQDVYLVHLPDPVLTILSPPPPFLPAMGVPTMLWPRWLKAFENYLKALDEKDLVESSKCKLLQNCLGPEGERIFTTLIQEETTYAAAVSTLTAFFNSDQMSQMHRLQFHQRAQMPEESVEEFVSALAELLRPCYNGNLQEKLIVDQLISKTNYPQLRKRLLLEGRESLTLSTALAIGKEVESDFSHSQVFEIHEVSVDIEDDLEPPVKRRRGRPRRGEERPKANLQLTKAPKRSTRHKDNKYSRKRCGGAEEPETGKTQCPDDEDVGASSSSLTVREDKEDGNDDDDDFSPFPTKPKGPCCPICVNRRFRDANKLARHMRTHTKEKPYSCPVCALTFSQSYHMTRHLKKQHETSRHVCTTCGQGFDSSAELQSHKSTHKSAVLSCPQCHKKFTNRDVFSCHVEWHNRPQSGRTKETGFQFSETKVKIEEIADVGEVANCNTSDLVGKEVEGDAASSKNISEDTPVDEGKKKGKGASKSQKGHFCPICVGRRFRGPNKLARHMRKHTKEKPFSCPVCSLTFSQSYHMTRHVRKQHGLGQYVCSRCGEGFSSWLELKTHRRTHTIAGLTCLACDKQFKDKSALASHLKGHKKVESSPQSLICGECGKVFSRMYHLKRHIMTHRKASNTECYKCPDCHRDFAFPEDLNKHLEIHVKENKGTCPKCNENFGSLKELQTHMEVHQKSYSCSICEKKFKVEYALKKHEQGHQNEQYYCSLCNKRFLKLSHYKRHEMVHGRRESRCPHCDGVFLQVTALKYHLRTHTEERPHQCSCCIETFELKEELEQHCLRHRKFKKERPYSCTRCDCAFSTLVELTAHMASHEGEQPVTCPVCGRTFLNKKKLEKHLTIHTGERPHLCSICGNGFPSAASLKLHAHIHTGEKPFQCSQCSKSFRSTSGLRLHSRQHMEAPPSYECPECGRTYGRMTELKMHQRYHTGDKPHACTCCSKRFISKDKLNVHMRIHTGERPYSCPHCGQTFTQTGDRNRHISKHHQAA
ncbi:zinc finger protein 665-like [Salarias fasciatus]|uniref:Zinc finger protein 665-like n=1 Tax=Salarias fasciatus TaxID=181472 RepID=A0A672F1E4_SALFA|nr:zinc finger protein 665-like [Salarias fasciatus]